MPPSIERRFLPIVLIIAGGLMLLVRGAVFESGGTTVHAGLVGFGPLCVLLGIAGLVDPRIVYSIGPRRKSFPVGIRIVGACCLVLSLTISGLLMCLHIY